MALFLRLLLALTYLKRWIERHIKYPGCWGKGSFKWFIFKIVCGCWECNCLWFPPEDDKPGNVRLCRVIYPLRVPFVMSLDESIAVYTVKNQKKKKEWCVTLNSNNLKSESLKGHLCQAPIDATSLGCWHVFLVTVWCEWVLTPGERVLFSWNGGRIFNLCWIREGPGMGLNRC